MKSPLPGYEMDEGVIEILRWFDEWIEEQLHAARAAQYQKNFEEGFHDGLLLATLPQLEGFLGTVDEATKKRIRALPNQQIETLCLTISDFTTHADLQQWLNDNAVAV